MINDPAPQKYDRLSKSQRSNNPHDKRTPTQRDKARLAYSIFTNRLGGVTQVISPDLSLGYLHSRQSHTYKVALLAGEVANDLINAAKGNRQATRLLRNLGGIDLAACEAAGLAHDLGHPPFGHVSEGILDDFLLGKAPFEIDQVPAYEPIDEPACKRYDNLLKPPVVLDGFEGNAQSFRTAARLDSNKIDRVGLDLTRASLAAILKYPKWRQHPEDRGEKFNTYSDDLSLFLWARAWVPSKIKGSQQTLEASVMDVADDLTYAVHDVQDFYMAGLIDPLKVTEDIDFQLRSMRSAKYIDFASLTDEEQLAVADQDRVQNGEPVNHFERSYRKLARQYKGYLEKQYYVDALTYVANVFSETLTTRFDRSTVQTAKVIDTCSEMLGRMIPSIKLYAEPLWPDGSYVAMEAQQWHIVQVLKQVSRGYVVDTPFVGLTQRAQMAAMRTLLQGLDQWLRGDGREGPRFTELPQPLASYLRDQDQSPNGTKSRVVYDFRRCRRAIVDYVCALTDAQALEQAQYLAGASAPRLRT